MFSAVAVFRVWLDCLQRWLPFQGLFDVFSGGCLSSLIGLLAAVAAFPRFVVTLIRYQLKFGKIFLPQ